MSTRGILGFHINGQDKIAYNDTSSNPEHLGKRVICDLNAMLTNRAALEQKVADLEAVPFQTMPTLQQIDKLKEFHRDGVGAADEEWYRLLRETQGKPVAILRAGLYEDEKQFAKDSMNCEWGYVINIDKSVLEIYRGGQKQSHGKGRFAELGRSDRRNYPIALVAEIGFETIQAEPDVAFRYLMSMSEGPPKRPCETRTHVERLQEARNEALELEGVTR